MIKGRIGGGKKLSEAIKKQTELKHNYKKN